jgi:membrane fusion protein, multidrug efflux system
VIRSRIFLSLVLIPLLLPACQKSDAATGLPPATGSGAPAVPSPPKVDAISIVPAGELGMLRATGTTHALKQAELGPKSSGVLSAVLVDEGMTVKKGQVLFRIDATNAVLATRQAEAGLAQARVGLSQAELDYNRTKPLSEQGTISPATWDQVRLGYERSKVAVQQAEAAVNSARSYANDATVVAPFAGVVTAKRKNAGETVTMMPATTVVIIQDISQIEVRVKLAESALSRIKAGDTMQVRWPSLDMVKELTITRLNPSVDPINRTVELVSVVPNPDGVIKAGMLVDVTFPSTGSGAPPAARSSATATVSPSAASATNTPLPSSSAASIKP